MEQSVKSGEEGFILVFTLLLMVVLVLLGVSAIDTSIFESTMSANDALYKRAFYQADGGANVSGVVIEENVSCPTGFDATEANGDALLRGNIIVKAASLVLWKNPLASAVVPTDANRDAYFFYNAADPTGTQLLRNNITLGGVRDPAAGQGSEAGAGFEGRGKSQAQGGLHYTYDVFSQHLGDRLSESMVQIVWRHVVGLEGSCNY